MPPMPPAGDAPASQAPIKPKIFVNFKPEPDPKSPAQLTTLLHGVW